MILKKSIFNTTLRFTAFAVVMVAFAGIAAAQGPVTNSPATTSNLTMTATVLSAVQLNISTGTGGATVSGSNSTGLFNVAFGNVNGLGTGTPTTGVTVSSDATGALYKTHSPVSLIINRGRCGRDL